MTSRDQELSATLEHLHEQLRDAQNLDPDVQARLRDALREIEDTLEEAGERGEEEPSLGERLTELARQFEESHPNLAAAVGRVVDTLANLGI
jgi:F0F1-type ATP synthase membrane subunit b/b'